MMFTAGESVVVTDASGDEPGTIIYDVLVGALHADVRFEDGTTRSVPIGSIRRATTEAFWAKVGENVVIRHNDQQSFWHGSITHADGDMATVQLRGLAKQTVIVPVSMLTPGTKME